MPNFCWKEVGTGFGHASENQSHGQTTWAAGFLNMRRIIVVVKLGGFAWDSLPDSGRWPTQITRGVAVNRVTHLQYT